MKTVIKDLPEIAIIGKEGFCTAEKNIVQELWADANAHFGEVAPLAKKKSDGTLAGVWGAMSDETMSFLPWTNNFSCGYYLAGVEVDSDKEVPVGWKKWILPARKYLIIDVQAENYTETFSNVIQQSIPEMQLKLCGAACDFTDVATGKNKLFFPVEVLGEKFGRKNEF